MSHAEFTPFNLMQKAAEFFERARITYRIVGSMASMAYGEPRFTNDINILVDLREKDVEAVVQEFPPTDYYVSQNAIREAIQYRSQFNIIHLPSGFKLDIIQKKETEFGKLDITSGRKLTIPGHYDAWFGIPENIILMKLRYYQEGVSEKHLRDIAGIVRVQGPNIDREYISHWAIKLGVESEWNMVLAKLDGLE